jgi:phosphoglycerate dehydrogenase-like enzyme
MQVLMSKAALKRIGARLKHAASFAEALTIDKSGAIWRDGVVVAEAAPQIAWLSRDMHATPTLEAIVRYIQRSESIRVVQTYQAGLDNPFYAAMAARNIRIVQSTAQAPAIAEYVVAHALSLLHPIETQAALQAKRAWARTPFREIAGMHVALIGFGAIGQEIERRLRAFGSRITIVRRTPAEGQISLSESPHALPSADLVILACALNDETRGLAGAAFFAALKPGAVLINVARGAIVDEDALRNGLSRQQPGFAVLDVFQDEPLAPDAWFWTHPRVRVTAHCANDGDGVTERGDQLFLRTLKEAGAGVV